MENKTKKSSIIWKSYWPLHFHATPSLSSKFQVTVNFIKFVDFPWLKFLSDYLKISQNATAFISSFLSACSCATFCLWQKGKQQLECWQTKLLFEPPELTLTFSSALAFSSLFCKRLFVWPVALSRMACDKKSRFKLYIFIHLFSHPCKMQ